MSRPLEVRVSGPLTPFVDGFWDELLRREYSPLSARNHLHLLAHLSRWMTAEGVGVEGLTSEQVTAFVTHRRGVGYTGFVSERALVPLLEVLRGVGVVPMRRCWCVMAVSKRSLSSIDVIWLRSGRWRPGPSGVTSRPLAGF